MAHTAQSRHSAWRWTLASGVITIALALVAALLPVVDWAPRGGLVGWLLLLAGVLEFGFGARRGADPVGIAALVTGFLTAAAGVLFVSNPTAPYLPVANVVTIWLALRGAWMLAMGLQLRMRKAGRWLAFCGVTDVILALLLGAGLPVSILVVTLFGPTPYIVAKFSLILAISFLITGVAQVAIGWIGKERASGSDELA